jgi:hypothetical protein
MNRTFIHAAVLGLGLTRIASRAVLARGNCVETTQQLFGNYLATTRQPASSSRGASLSIRVSAYLRPQA